MRGYDELDFMLMFPGQVARPGFSLFKLSSNIPNGVSDFNSSNYSFNKSSSPQNLLKQLTNLQLNTEKIFTPQLRILEFLLCRYKCSRISLADLRVVSGPRLADRLWLDSG